MQTLIFFLLLCNKPTRETDWVHIWMNKEKFTRAGLEPPDLRAGGGGLYQLSPTLAVSLFCQYLF